jgi:hypothetical protein
MWQGYCFHADNEASGPDHIAMDIHSLKKGSQYRVQQDFHDYYRNRFTKGEQLTLVETHFLPYHGGYTVVFKERTLYLQEEENATILDSFGEYLSLVTA